MVKKKAETKEKVTEKSSKEKPSWLKYTEKDIEGIILKLSKKGMTSEKIGLVLRDSYGIPTTKVYNKKVSAILKEHKLYEDANLKNLRKKQEILRKHLEKNKQDKRTKRALTIITARIAKYDKYLNR